MADDQISSEIVRNHDCEIAGIIANKQSYQALVPPLYERCLSDAEFDIMTEMYCVLYPCVDIVWISRFYKETKKVIINGEEYLSLKSRSERSAVISARWVGNNGIDQTGNEPSHVGAIRSLFEHTISIIPQGTSERVPISLTHVLAKVVWYESHSERNHFGQSIIVASSVLHQLTRASFIPISRIKARCAYLQTNYTFAYGEDSVVICVPLLLKIYIAYKLYSIFCVSSKECLYICYHDI